MSTLGQVFLTQPELRRVGARTTMGVLAEQSLNRMVVAKRSGGSMWHSWQELHTSTQQLHNY